MSKNITNDYEAFTVVKRHLLSQNTRSIDIYQECQYRGYKNETIDKLWEEVYALGTDNMDTEHEIMIELLQELKPEAMCAVGALIDDSFYSRLIENKAISESLDDEDSPLEALKKSNPDWEIDDDSLSMLNDLQRLHDSVSALDWDSSLYSFESRFINNKWIG
jgi:hypothetical protein